MIEEGPKPDSSSGKVVRKKEHDKAPSLMSLIVLCDDSPIVMRPQSTSSMWGKARIVSSCVSEREDVDALELKAGIELVASSSILGNAFLQRQMMGIEKGPVSVRKSRLDKISLFSSGVKAI